SATAPSPAPNGFCSRQGTSPDEYGVATDASRRSKRKDRALCRYSSPAFSELVRRLPPRRNERRSDPRSTAPIYTTGAHVYRPDERDDSVASKERSALRALEGYRERR